MRQETITDEITAINERIAEKIGQQKYRVWFSRSTRFSIAENYLKVGVPNSFIGNWIENHFLSVITQAAMDVTGCGKKITFNIEPELSGSQRKPQPHSRVEPVKKARSRTTGSRIMPRQANERLLKLTMDNFIVGSSNQLAYNAAISMVSQEDSLFNPLFIHGGYGLGKTHLMQAMCNKSLKQNPAIRWIYVSAEEFTNQFVLSLKTKKLEAFRKRFRQADLLAIDDIHFLASKPSTQEEFLHTFNTIDLAGKKIVLASDAHPKMIGQLCERLVSRFVSGMVVRIEPPDFKMRCRICRQRAAAMNKYLPEKVIAYIAENMRTNVREIEGALLKLTAYASLCGQDVSPAMAKEVLAEHISRTDPIVHISDIESATATFFGVTSTELHSPRKDRTISTARSFSMYLGREYTRMSFPEIGRLMGNKNHATVIMACRKVESLLKRNASVNWRGPNGNKIANARDIVAQLKQNIC